MASAKRRGTKQAAGEAWLKGRIWDETGDHLTPSHTRKNGRILRYYISNRLLKERDPQGWRLSAVALEAAVTQAMLDWLSADTTLMALGGAPDEIAAAKARITQLIKAISDREPAPCAQLRAVLIRVDLAPQQMVLQLEPGAVAQALGLPDGALGSDLLSVTCPLMLKRRGVEAKIILGTSRPSPDRRLQRNLAKAHLWLEAIKQGASLEALAKAHQTSASVIRTRLCLATLSPKIQKAIMEGTQPPELSTSALLKMKLPNEWAAQERKLGI